MLFSTHETIFVMAGSFAIAGILVFLVIQAHQSEQVGLDKVLRVIAFVVVLLVILAAVFLTFSRPE